MSIQVLICTCGDTLNEDIDFEELTSFLEGIDDVTQVSITKAACTKSAKDDLVKTIRRNPEHKLLALACTRSVCMQPLEEVMKGVGYETDNLVLVNMKEQLAQVHKDVESTTDKAKMMVRSALEKLRYAEPKEILTFERYQDVVVVGSGIAGLTAASELADQGYNVHVVEKNPSIGGVMPLISKTYPEEDCTMCLRGPRMIELLTKKGITYHVSTEIKDAVKTSKGHTLTLEKKSFDLDPKPTRELGQPTEIVPTKDGGYQLVYPKGQEEENIKIIMESKCGSCSSIFPSGLMEFDEPVGEKTINAGAVILATGFNNFDPTGIPKWGYGLDNVITQYQLARMLDPLGPTGGKVLRPKHKDKPNKIVMVQCVGSRDPEFNSYCSKYCCLATIKHATLVKEFQNPDAEITILFRDIRASGYGFEEFYNDAKEMGINFVHGDITSVTPSGDERLIAYDDGKGESQRLESDMLVLSIGMIRTEGTDKLADMLNVEVADSGFFKAVDEKVANIRTRAPGVYIAGTCTGPKNIPDSISQAGAAAFMAGSYLEKYISKKKDHPRVIEEHCGVCGICRSVCPYEAITIPEEDYPQWDPELCVSCGLCVSSCPTHAIETSSYGFDVIDAQINAIIDSRPEGKPLIMGFLCDDCGYNLLDTTGFEGYKYTSNFVPIYVNCMSNLSLRNVLKAVRAGVDSILLVGCVKERCHFLKGTKRSKGQMQVIEEFFNSTGIRTPIKILESSGTMVNQFLKALDDLEKQIEEA
jgi:heterodisulfide reductase subunit A